MSLISQNAVPKVHENRDSEDTEEPNPKPSNLKRSNKRIRTDNKYDKASKIGEEEKEIKKLESFLFGNLDSSIEFGKEIGGGGDDEKPPSFFLDRSPGANMVYKEDIYQDVEEERKPVWVDEEEERTEVNLLSVRRLIKLRKEAGEKLISGAECVLRLRAHHVKMNPRTDWAEVNQKCGDVLSSDDESDDESGVTTVDGYGNDVLRSDYELVENRRVLLSYFPDYWSIRG